MLVNKMKENNNIKNLRNYNISASEIGQYYFCSMAWYLQKCGYKPESKYLEIGSLKHKKIGKIVEKTQKEIRKSNLLKSILIIIFEVVI